MSDVNERSEAHVPDAVKLYVSESIRELSRDMSELMQDWLRDVRSDQTKLDDRLRALENDKQQAIGASSQKERSRKLLVFIGSLIGAVITGVTQLVIHQFLAK